MSTATATKWAFEPGTEVRPGRTVVRLLGGGDRYEAWLGWDEHLASPVVLKLLRPDQLDDERARGAIGREADLLGRLAHPGLLRCFAAELEGERPHLVLEFLDGPRLSTLLRRYGPLAEEQLVALGVELASVLSYLRHERLLHLDVKPQNIIMGAPPRLIDLSIARRLDELPALRHPLGTDAYMAPEQCDRERLATLAPAADVWGVGATLYEAANGYRPFRRKSDDEPHPQLTDDALPMHRRVPEPVAKLISACLERDPAQRPSLGDLMDGLEDLLPDARKVALRRLRRRIR